MSSEVLIAEREWCAVRDLYLVFRGSTLLTTLSEVEGYIVLAGVIRIIENLCAQDKL